jgi:GNAT superfamily N-acetyltransferase
MGKSAGLVFAFGQTPLADRNIEDINRLLVQLFGSPRRLDTDQLKAIIGQPNVFILTARDGGGHIVGMATLIIYETLLRKVGFIEDVIVDKGHQGKGLGRVLMEYLIGFAKSKNLAHIDLTSTPKRQEANRLYLSLGFKRRDTNCYRLIL